MRFSSSKGMGVSATKRVIRFPTERTAHPARGGVTVIDVLKLRARALLGRLANWIGTPGAIAPTEINDAMTGQQITVAVEALLVRLTVNGRDFYFNRMTGRFDGTGSSS
jgi:hypothetical protein